jgi:hypothetical protein
LRTSFLQGRSEDKDKEIKRRKNQGSAADRAVVCWVLPSVLGGVSIQLHDMRKQQDSEVESELDF